MRRIASKRAPIRRARTGAEQCELCLRATPRYTVHHLIPRARGGSHGPKANLCSTCHRQLHAMFTEATLAQELYSIELLRCRLEINQYLRWIRKQKGASGFRVRRASVRQ